MLSAASVSRMLAVGGLRPLPSGTSRMREGIRVSGGRRGAPVLVAVDLDNVREAEWLAMAVAVVLMESGCGALEVKRQGAMLRVTRRREVQ